MAEHSRTSDPQTDGQVERPDSPEFSVAYTRYALGLLVFVYVFNFIDRQILTILLEDIKGDLGLTDTQLGVLGGLAFAILYSTLGVPIARFADRSSRRTVIAAACFAWSGFTALTGSATSFLTITLARVGVGIGEAGCSPPAHSMIADYFPPHRRATALAIYALGIPIGGAIGLAAGGYLSEQIGWRAAFVVVGLPGLGVALLVRLTLRNPTRGYWEGGEKAGAPIESLGETFRFMWGLRSFRHMSFAAALHALYGYGAANFNPSFFRRVHEMSASEVGLLLALIGITFGALGTFLGGRMSDWLRGRDQRWYMWVPAIATLASIPFVFAMYLYPNGYVAMALYLPGAVAAGMWLGPTFSMTQTLVKPGMRSLASAILLFVINLIGMGLGPVIVGFLSEQMADRYGAMSIGYALLITIVTCATWSALHYALAGRTIRDDLTAHARGKP